MTVFPYLYLFVVRGFNIFGVTPGWIKRYKDQGNVTIGGTPGIPGIPGTPGTPVGNHG